MQQNSTLKKLAEILHLSVSTVSRALKDHPDISEQTKKKVQELALILEYEPNNFAIQLRNNTSKVFGIIVPTVDNFFYESFIDAVEKEARLNNYSVLIMQSGESKDAEIANLKILKNNRVAGIFVSITSETIDIEPFLKLQQLNIPILFFNRVPEHDACNKICFEDKLAAKIATNAFIVKPKKHVLALFGHGNLSISKRRLESFKEVFALNSPNTQLTIHFPLSLNESKNFTLKALEQPNTPDGIFCMGDLILVGAMQAVHEKKLQVPNDIAIVTISNGFIPTMYNPKITYVETSGFKLGKLAFNRMMSCLDGDTILKELRVDSILVTGGSL